MENNSRIRFSVLINMLLTIVFFLITVTPYLARSANQFVMFPLILLWIISALFIDSKAYKSKVFYSWMLLWLYQILYRLIGFSQLPINNFVVRLYIFATPFLCYFILKEYNYKELKKLSHLLLFIVAANIVSNVLLGEQDTDVFNSTNSFDSPSNNAGGTMFVAACLFAAGSFFLLVKNYRPFIIKVLGILLLSLSIYYIAILNSRATAFFLFILLILGLIISDRFNKNLSFKQGSLMLAISVVLLVLVPIVLPSLSGSSLISDRISIRIDDVVSALNGNLSPGGTGSFGVRIYLAQVSLNTFTQSIFTFIFGIGENFHNADNLFDLVRGGVGQHSEFIDVLARYGALGGFLTYYSVYQLFDSIKTQLLNTNMVGGFKVLFLVFILYSILNNSFQPEIFMVAFLLFPAYLKVSNY